MKVKNRTVAKFPVKSIFFQHRPSKEIQSDIGREYNTEIVRGVVKYCHAKMRYTDLYMPYSN